MYTQTRWQKKELISQPKWNWEKPVCESRNTVKWVVVIIVDENESISLILKLQNWVWSIMNCPFFIAVTQWTISYNYRRYERLLYSHVHKSSSLTFESYGQNTSCDQRSDFVKFHLELFPILFFCRKRLRLTLSSQPERLSSTLEIVTVKSFVSISTLI